MDRNTFEDTFTFMAEMITTAFLAIVVYRNLLYRNLPSLSYRISELILILLMAGCCLTGFFLQKQKHRNFMSIIINFCSAVGIYSVFAYFDIRTYCIAAILILFFVLSFIYIVYLYRQIGGKILHKKQLKHSAVVLMYLFGSCMGILMVCLGWGNYFHTGILSADKKYVNYSESDTVSANIETILNLEDSRWSALDLQEKINILQTVADIENNYMCLPDDFTVTTAVLDEDTIANYNPMNDEITVNTTYADSLEGWETAEAVIHECFHGLEYKMAEIYCELDAEDKDIIIFEKFETYASEFENYIDGDESLSDYYDQECEEDARDYASSRIEIYQSIAANYNAADD